MKTSIAVLAAGIILAAPAAASTPRIALSPSTVHRGQSVRAHGVISCPAGDVVTLLSKAFSPRHEFAGVPAISARVGAGGAYSVRTRIPADRRPGRYHVTGRCGGGNLGVAPTLRVIR